MDWTLVISRNHALLLRIVAELFAMARLVDGGTAPLTSPACGRGGPEERRGAFTLPRHLYNAILLVLRPAEAAIRRLIVIAARGLVLAPRPSNPICTGLFSLPNAGLTRAPRFQLIDPLKQFNMDAWNQDEDSAMLTHRIEAVDPAIAYQQAQSAEAPVSATLLFNRLRAMRLALNDLPRQARRLARWHARRNLMLAAKGPFRPCRLSPFRPGPPPGYRRKELHPVDAVLKDVHYFAQEVWGTNTS